MKKIVRVLLVFVLFLSLFSCSNKKEEKNYFTLWNDCKAISSLKEYVEDVTNPNSKHFIPKEDRIATFDMDGTIIGELYPSYFEYNILEYRILDDPNYKNKASEEEKEAALSIRNFVRNGVKLPDHFDMIHAHAAAKAYAGLTIKEFDTYVKKYMEVKANGFEGMTYGESFYKPMLEIFTYLKANDFTYYIVSGSDRFICRTLVETIGIGPDRVIGMDVVYKSNNQGDAEGQDYEYKVTDTLIRTDELIIKNLKTNKVKQISQEIGKTPVLSFGNSNGDCAMHNYCLANDKYESKAFMLIADDEARDHANREKALGLKTEWEAKNYIVISMRDDFKTIYGDGVKKVDFTF